MTDHERNPDLNDLARAGVDVEDLIRNAPPMEPPLATAIKAHGQAAADLERELSRCDDDQRAVLDRDVPDWRRRIARSAGRVEAAAGKATGSGDLDTLAPTFGSLYGVDRLEADSNRRLVTLATLPPWPKGDPTSGHGWGPDFDRLFGGGLAPGSVVLVVASTSKAGKTSLVSQWADGLALACVDAAGGGGNAPLTPVLWLSEMPADALTWRTLARWTGYPSTIFRAGRSWHDKRQREVAFEAARAALTSEPLAEARSHWTRYVQPRALTAGGQSTPRALADLVARWTAKIAGAHPGRPIVPVVVVDPIQRFEGGGDSEVTALNAIAEALAEAAREGGWLLFVTSDTNKEAAKGAHKTASAQERAAGVQRGSYRLAHVVDAMLLLDPVCVALGKGASEMPLRLQNTDDGHRMMGLSVALNRWGKPEIGKHDATAVLDWQVDCGRWAPRGVLADMAAPPAGSEIVTVEAEGDDDDE